MTIEKIKLGLAIWITALIAAFSIITIFIGQYIVLTYHKELEIISYVTLFLMIFSFVAIVIYNFLTDPEYWRD